jgi:hypothetical protein
VLSVQRLTRRELLLRTTQQAKAHLAVANDHRDHGRAASDIRTFALGDARHHAYKRDEAAKVENETKNAAARAHNALPTTQAAVHLKNAETMKEQARDYQHHTITRPGMGAERGRELEKHSAKQAIDQIQKANALVPNPDHQKEIDRLTVKHNPDDIPRDELGRFAPK